MAISQWISRLLRAATAAERQSVEPPGQEVLPREPQDDSFSERACAVGLPDHVRAVHTRARLLMERGHYEQATELFIRFVAEAPQMAADGYCGAAQAARGSHGQADTFPPDLFNAPLSAAQRRDAINYYRLALEANDRHVKSLIGLAHMLDAGSPERRTLLEKARAVRASHPRSSRGWDTAEYALLLSLGDAYFVAAETSRAEQVYKDAIQLSRHRLEAYKRLALLYERTNQTVALRALARAMSDRNGRPAGRRVEGASPGADASRQPVWCVVANIIAERPYGPGGEIRMAGTRRFSPGTKVYCLQYIGDDRMKVVGLHRGSRRHVTTIVPRSVLTDCRAKLVYSPQVIRRLTAFWDGTERSRVWAEEMVRVLGGA